MFDVLGCFDQSFSEFSDDSYGLLDVVVLEMFRLPLFILFAFAFICHFSLCSVSGMFRKWLPSTSLRNLTSLPLLPAPVLPRLHHGNCECAMHPRSVVAPAGPDHHREAGFSRKPSYLRCRCWLTCYPFG